MTDVRLTATNPEDSSVVPVACNSRGELLVEGSEGGEYLPLTGGDLTGPLTSTSSATFASFVESDLFSVSRSAVANKDSYVSKLSVADTGKHFKAVDTGSNPVAAINSDGSADFAAQVVVGDHTSSTGGIQLREVGSMAIRRDSPSGSGVLTVYKGGTDSADATVAITNDGNATFTGIVSIDRPVAGTPASGWSCFNGQNNGTTTSSIKADGSAVFSGDVVVGSRGKQWMIVESNGLAHLVEQTREATTYPVLRDYAAELDKLREQMEEVQKKLDSARGLDKD